MKRVVEKVKDIVEVCPFMHLHDFAADPGLTLAGYHFTDITADMMGRWIDRIADVKAGQGSAFALAGFRGVGKSHFLAVVAAVVSMPELRSKIPDPHVEASADRLSRRHGLVASVRRGSGASLLDELKNAVAETLGVDAGGLSDSLPDLLSYASEHAGDLPFVLLIDTEFGRGSRVARDDGARLSEIAETAKMLGVFVGVALDDDISGADGPNSSIAGNFTIDYLDQDHLYKIVDTHIFAKHSQMLPVLHEIYEYYREVLPGFRWSEQRFSSLYPLHPATVEIAPLIRLYMHDFALLGFASEAGVKIMGRPANSLIGLDEVFASVETKLRTVDALKHSFTAFDRLEQEVVSKTPVQFRLPAKLILKGLFMLSLNGQGSTAAEIAASMMIFDENTSGSAAIDVSNLLDSFAAALPDSIDRADRDDAGAKYCFKLAAKDHAEDVLAEAIKELSDETVWSVLQRLTAEKFSDLEMSAEFGTHATHCSVEWRGALRRGEIVWNAGDEVNHPTDRKEPLDWIVLVEKGQNEAAVKGDHWDCQTLVWGLAEPSADEKDTICRHHLLQTNSEIRGHYGEGLATATHVQSIAVEKIWQRVFLQDGRLIDGETEYEFTEEARTAYALFQLFTFMLAPVFENQFVFHPTFLQLLGMKQASALIANFFGGADAESADAQQLAEAFAVPLGLADRVGGTYVPVPAETLFGQPVIESTFGSAESDSSIVIPLVDISMRLNSPPYGLTRESQHLILAALVAHRQFEFVTSSGNRINHRSLDLQIIWDDIIGVAKPLDELYSPERLLLWAKLITGNSGIKSFEKAEDRLLIVDSLSGWLEGWKEGGVLDEFDALPDENLNAAIWRTAANLRKSFGAMAEAIDALIREEISLDQSIHSIAELFSDSEAEFEKKKSDLRVLRDFTAGVSKRDEIKRYLSLSEITADPQIESLRQGLLDAVRASHFEAAAEENEVLWASFKELYSNYYAEKHDAVMNADAATEKLKGIMSSIDWSVFESVSRTSWVDQRYVSKARALTRLIRQLYCKSKVREVLASKPFCSCSFSLAEFAALSDMPDQLQRTVSGALTSFKKRVVENGETVAGSMKGQDADSMRQIVETLKEGEDLPPLTGQQIRVLTRAADSSLDVGVDEGSERVTRGLGDIFQGEASEWEHEIDRLEVFANTKA